MLPPHSCKYVLLALSLTAAGAAHAEGETDLRVRSTVSVKQDSNLFRLSANADTNALIGQSSTAETIRTTTLGLSYNRAYSLQKVQFSLNAVNYQYQNFEYLSFSALNYDGAWNWSYTPHFYGVLSTSRTQSLNSYADSQNFQLRNERVDTNNRADFTYELDARWRLVGALSRYSQTNQQPLIEESDYRAITTDAGVRYVLPSGSSAVYVIRTTDGTNTNPTQVSPGIFDDGYKQTDNELQLTWAISANTSAEFKAGHRSRLRANVPQRNFSGATGSANLNWALSANTVFTAGWARDLASYETSDINFTQSDRFFLGSVWHVSPKTKVNLQLSHLLRDYRGSPFGLPESQRHDIYRSASISIDWEPVSYLLLNASLQNQKRSSNLPGLDYNSNMVNLSARFAF